MDKWSRARCSSVEHEKPHWDPFPGAVGGFVDGQRGEMLEILITPFEFNSIFCAPFASALLDLADAVPRGIKGLAPNGML